MHTTHLEAPWARVVPTSSVSWTRSLQVPSMRQHAVPLDRPLPPQAAEHLLPSRSTSLRSRERPRLSSDQRRPSVTRDLPLLQQDRLLLRKFLLRLPCLPPRHLLVAPIVKVALSHSVLSDQSRLMASLPCSRANQRHLVNNCLA